jgi:hypothetical protein
MRRHDTSLHGPIYDRTSASSSHRFAELVQT